MSLFLNLLFETDSYSNEYFLVNFGFDTAENEPYKVCPLSAYRSPRYNSFVDDLLNPEIFVTTLAASAFPAYLITYTND